MPARPLSENPSFENLKKQSKRLHKAVRAGDAASVAQVREFHPRAAAALAGFSLADAQLVTARGYGFPSWPRLKKHLEVVERFVWDPPPEAPAVAGTEPLSHTFIRWACLTYGNWHPSQVEKARRLLSEHPELSQADIFAAATAGDLAAARAMLAQDPSLASAKGGPLGWEPLLHACYSRFDGADAQHSTLEVARLLIRAGADPNAGFLWRGNVPPFTALTGAFGEGEDGTNQPPHRDRDALARLLLEAGADPNDEQTLYNRHFRPDDGHLKLLLAFGLGQDKGGPWFRRLGDRLHTPARMLVEELWAAARKGFFDRVKLLVAHGTDVNTPGVRDGRTPYEAALMTGNREIAQYLLAHGAKRVALAPEEAFAAAALAGRGDEARSVLAAHPRLLETLGPDGRIELVHRAVEGDRRDGVRLLAELGVALSGTTVHQGVGMYRAVTPMHNAAWAGDVEMVRLLVELGADPSARDATYQATPLGWALHNRQRAVVDYLLPFSTIVEAVRAGGVERIAELLEKDPMLANATDGEGTPVLFHVDADGPRAEEVLDLLLAHGAKLDARNGQGRTVLEEMQRRGRDETVRALRQRGAPTS